MLTIVQGLAAQVRIHIAHLRALRTPLKTTGGGGGGALLIRMSQYDTSTMYSALQCTLRPRPRFVEYSGPSASSYTLFNLGFRVRGSEIRV